MRIPIGVGRRQVDLVEHSHDFEVVFKRQITVGQCLRLDALRRIDYEHHAFARRKAATHFVAEVDVAGGVDEVEHMPLPLDANVLRLNGDAALALEIHRVEVLRTHVAHLNGTGHLEDAVGKG